MPETVNISPSFAREAAEHLRDGNIQSAIELCLAGTKAFPNYATGNFVLGKCYDAFGRNVEALVAYREALRKLPGNPTLQTLVKNAEEKEQEEFRKAVEEQEKRFEGKNDTILTEQPLAEEPPATKEESAIEYLAKRLQDVKRINPQKQVASEQSSAIPAGGVRSLKIVTATMAEILAGQGEYVEAINAYKELQKEHPDEEEKYLKRIGELQQLRAIQQKEKHPDSPENKKAS